MRTTVIDRLEFLMQQDRDATAEAFTETERQRIVRAVNTFDEAKAALRNFVCACNSLPNTSEYYTVSQLEEYADYARAILAQMEERES